MPLKIHLQTEPLHTFGACEGFLVSLVLHNHVPFKDFDMSKLVPADVTLRDNGGGAVFLFLVGVPNACLSEGVGTHGACVGVGSTVVSGQSSHKFPTFCTLSSASYLAKFDSDQCDFIICVGLSFKV